MRVARCPLFPSRPESQNVTKHKRKEAAVKDGEPSAKSSTYQKHACNILNPHSATLWYFWSSPVLMPYHLLAATSSINLLAWKMPGVPELHALSGYSVFWSPQITSHWHNCRDRASGVSDFVFNGFQCSIMFHSVPLRSLLPPASWSVHPWPGIWRLPLNLPPLCERDAEAWNLSICLCGLTDLSILGHLQAWIMTAQCANAYIEQHWI